MKKLIYLMLPCVFISACTKCQYLGQVKLIYSLFIIAGESNGAGTALNSGLTTLEKSTRSNAFIMNHWNNNFENLHIGFNNYDTGQSQVHGLESAMANESDTNAFNGPLFMVKAGFGGARIKWFYDSTYTNALGSQSWEVLKYRVDTAIKQLTAINGGIRPKIYLAWFQGINDAVVVTANWKDSTKAVFARMRTRWGKMPILMPYMPADPDSSVNPTLANRIAFNTKITELSSEVTDFYPIPTSTAAIKNESHWNAAGFRTIAFSILKILKEHYQY